MLSWVFLVISSALEVLWAAGLKYAVSPLEWGATVVCIVGSFIFMVLAAQRMGAAFAYVVFVTFGTVGTYMLDVLYFGKELKWAAVVAIAVILFSVIKLKQNEV